MKLLHKQLDEIVVEKNACEYQEEITGQLVRASENRTWKNDIPVQEKTDRKSNDKANQKGGNVRTYCAQRRINKLLVENEVITDEIDHDIQQCITTPTGRITESLKRHQLPKWKVQGA